MSSEPKISASLQVPEGSTPIIEDGRIVGCWFIPEETPADDEGQDAEADGQWVQLGYISD